MDELCGTVGRVTLNKVKDYKQLLLHEFEERCRKNPRYSLRAYARSLGISASTLSEVLNGHYGLSYKKAKKVSRSLGLSKAEQQWFCDLVALESARSPNARKQAELQILRWNSTSKHNTLELDNFKIIADWYHYAILELTYLKSFVSDIRWIAKKLQIPETTVTSAVERLKRVGLLTQDVKGKFICTEDFLATPTDIPSQALRQHHQQFLNKAAFALRTQSVKERDFSSTVIALAEEDLARFKELIRDFRRSLSKDAMKSQNKKHVYCLGTQLFRISEV